MKKEYKIIGLAMLMLLFFSCKKNEVEFTEAGPTAGFADADLEINGTYSDQSTYTLSSGINLFNNNGAAFTVNFSIDETTVDAAIENAIALVQESISVTNPETDIDIVTVDFSEIDADTLDVEYTFDILIASTDLEIGLVEKTITVKVSKERIPRFVLDGETASYLIDAGGTGTVDFTVELEVFDKPVEEDVTFPLNVSFNSYDFYPGSIADYGTKFTMDTVVSVTAGNTTWSTTLTVDADLFAGDENFRFYLEAYEDNIPAGTDIIFVDGTDYWSGFKVGMTWDWLYLMANTTYTLVLDATATGEVYSSLDIPFKEVNNSSFEMDYEIPISFNWGTTTLGTDILNPETVADIGSSNSDWTFNFIVDADQYDQGDTTYFWIEVHDATVAGYPSLRIDDALTSSFPWYYTKLQIVKAMP